jgi:hypothetical protein
LKGILSGTQVTQDGDRLTVFQIGLFRRVAETHTSLEINNVCQKQEHLSLCFPVRIVLVIERNTSCNLDFSSWLYLLFVLNKPTERYGRKPCISQKQNLYKTCRNI